MWISYYGRVEYVGREWKDWLVFKLEDCWKGVCECYYVYIEKRWVFYFSLDSFYLDYRFFSFISSRIIGMAYCLV